MSGARIAVLLPAVTMLVAGCATKDWVNTVIGKERAETEQRVARVEDNVTGEGRRVSALDERLGGEARRLDDLGVRVKAVDESATAARGFATSARERADGAMTRADGAFAKAEDVDGRLTRLWNSRHKRSAVDTTQVQFAFDRSDLDDRAQTSLLDVIAELKKNQALSVVLEGYTDPRGPAGYNLELSRRRVESVRRYLVSQGVDLWRINSIGLGVLAAADVPNPQKRRVSVTLTLAE